MSWDFIQGEKFISIANFVYSPKNKDSKNIYIINNTFNASKVIDGSVIYSCTLDVKSLLEVIKTLNKEVVVVSHNSDENIHDIIIPNNVRKLFTQNVDMVDTRIESLPIGLENERWDRLACKKIKMVAKLKIPKKEYDLVYMNHNINTNPLKRQLPYEILKDKKFVTTHSGHNGYRFDVYLDNVYNHRFVVCPEGNGIDTVRTWETLYMGSFPIEKRNHNNVYYNDLPICFVDDWEQVTEEYLNRWLAFADSKEWNMDKLNFSYWKNKIFTS